MAIATYSDLLVAIPQWGWRTDDAEYEAAVPDFIRLCEREMNNKLRLAEQETTAVLTLVDGLGNLPADFLELRTQDDGRRTASLVSPGFAFDTYAPSSYDATYTIVGSKVRSFSLGQPTAAITYYAKIPPLGPDNQTNWLLTKDERAYLYGSLAQGAVFSKDNEDAQKWGSLFEAALADLRRSDQMARYGGARVRPRMITP